MCQTDSDIVSGNFLIQSQSPQRAARKKRSSRKRTKSSRDVLNVTQNQENRGSSLKHRPGLVSKIRCFRCCRQLFDPLLKPVESTRGKAKSSKGYESVQRCPKHHMGPRKQRESLPIPPRGRAQIATKSGIFWVGIQNPLFSVL